jgi:hypothetical protein
MINENSCVGNSCPIISNITVTSKELVSGWGNTTTWVFATLGSKFSITV